MKNKVLKVMMIIVVWTWVITAYFALTNIFAAVINALCIAIVLLFLKANHVIRDWNIKVVRKRHAR